jgi:hypothetical protein
MGYPAMSSETSMKVVVDVYEEALERAELKEYRMGEAVGKKYLVVSPDAIRWANMVLHHRSSQPAIAPTALEIAAAEELIRIATSTYRTEQVWQLIPHPVLMVGSDGPGDASVRVEWLGVAIYLRLTA